MRVLYLDIDTLRPDHLGCYGYHRTTSPAIDEVARQSVRFDNVYVSDAPCLPSRAAMFLGQFGIHTGVVNHGGLCADPRPLLGAARDFNTFRQRPGFIECLRHQNYYPVSVSPFAERHSAWWFYAGWREMYNPGRFGQESAEHVMPSALEWIARNAREDNWVLHVNLWDPHTPFRAPEGFGNPFEDEPVDHWYTEELREKHWNSFGPHSAQEPTGDFGKPSGRPRVPDQIANMADYKRWVDGYDCGIAYADENCGRLLNALSDQGVLDDTMIVITSDHGENHGELGVFGDHQTADHVTSRVPMIIRMPGQAPAVDTALHYQSDVAATLVELLGGKVPGHWDGASFAEAFRAGQSRGREYVVLSQGAWACQRGVRWGQHIYLRTWHTGLKDLPARMLFDVATDPHEQHDLAPAQPALVAAGQKMLDEWTAQMLGEGPRDASGLAPTDPFATVMAEGGPLHSREIYTQYLAHLRNTSRGRHADFLAAHPTGIAE